MPKRELVLAILLASAGCTAQVDPTPPPAYPAVTTVGEPVSCLQLTQVRDTQVRDDWTIDFEATGGRVYRNTLSARCPRLGFEKAFTYTTSLAQLCSTDIIYVLDATGGQVRRGAACGLGKFVPVEYRDSGEE